MRGREANLLNKTKRRFNRLLVESFLESIDFGEVILFFIELNSPIQRNNIAENPELFTRELKSIQGDNTPIIEERIIKNLCTKLKIQYETIANLKFPQQIRTHQKIYHKRKNSKMLCEVTGNYTMEPNGVLESVFLTR